MPVTVITQEADFGAAGGTGPQGPPVAVMEDGVELAARASLNFADGIVATDNPAEDRVDVTVDASEAVADTPGLLRPGVCGPRLSYPMVDSNQGYDLLEAGFTGQYSAFPGLVKAAAGHGIAIWRRGTGHESADSSGEGVLVISRSDEYWQNWSTPAVFVTVPTRDIRGASLSLLNDGRIALAGWASDTQSDLLPHSAFVLYSDDDGATFPYYPAVVAAAPCPDDFDEFTAGGGAILDVGGGVLLWPLYGNSVADTDWSTAVLRSTDNGATWPTQIIVHAGDGSNQYAELALCLCADGSVLACSRDNLGVDLSFARSTDGGVTWADLGMKIDSTGHPNMFVTSYGRVYIVVRRGSGSLPALLWSDDHGDTWVPNPLTPSNLIGMNIDSRFKADGVTGVRMVYAAIAEPFPGLVAVANAVEAGDGGAEIGMRYIAERASLSPAGVMAGPRIVDGHFDGQGMAISGDNSYPWTFVVDSLNRVAINQGVPTSADDTSLVYLGIERRRTTFVGAPLTVTDMPAAATDVPGTLLHADLTGMSAYRLSANTLTGVTGGTLKVQYSLTGSTWVDLTATISIATAALRQLPASGAWTSIPTAARTQVQLKIVSAGGDAATDPIISQVALEARAIA